MNWYAYGARYYDSAIGRFTGVDPIADQFPELSVYNYASNDPIVNIDLHGLQGIRYDHDLDPNLHDATREERDVYTTGLEKGFGFAVETVLNEIPVVGELKSISEGDIGGALLSMLPFGKALKKGGKAIKDAKKAAKGTEGSGDDFVTVYTATDGPVDLNRHPSGPSGSSESHGGTYVTETDITDPRSFLRHNSENIPFNLTRDTDYPTHISKIRTPRSSLRPDPSDRLAPAGNHWLPPNPKGANVIERYMIVGEKKNLLPIIKQIE